MVQKRIVGILLFALLSYLGRSQDVAHNDIASSTFNKAYELAYDGNHKSARKVLVQVLETRPNNLKARALLASTYSWSGQYDKARKEFNKITSQHRNNAETWISAVKNELYAKNDATALGLANKAIHYVKNNPEIARLKNIALERIKDKKYGELGWHNQNSVVKTAKTAKKKQKKERVVKKAQQPIAKAEVEKEHPKTMAEKEVLNNRVAIRNSFRVFDQRYDPMVYSSISFKRKTSAGSIIPRLNYSNRLGKHGLQYDLDFYPKFSKRFYAYMNYGYSNSEIYPSHKVGGDLYANLPGAFEFSAGGRFISFATKDVSVITNSLGHYRGNYYFSLRSYITPKENNLTRISGNMLVRKYLKDGENYMGVNFGMGYSPELRQLTSGDELLAETLLYIESQRLSFEYQFTGKKNPQNSYRTNVGVSRQELTHNSGSFFWSVSAGLTYQVTF